MDINSLTVGQIKEIASLIGCGNQPQTSDTLNGMIGKKVIVRTYSAGSGYGSGDG